MYFILKYVYGKNVKFLKNRKL